MGNLKAMTAEARKQAGATRRERLARIERFGFLNPMKAIRAKCLDCNGGSAMWTRDCTITGCPLWPYRMGRRPKTDDLLVAVYDPVSGEVTERRPLGGTRAMSDGTVKEAKP